MNTIIYNLLNKIESPKNVDEAYLNNLYELYKFGSLKCGYEVFISEEEFKRFFKVIYNVLRFRISDSEFEIVTDYYLRLLMADAVDGYEVNIKWFIDHVWYLHVVKSDCVDPTKYNDCPIFIQRCLVKEFELSEGIKEKVYRRIYTGYMSHI